ncbi:MAG: carboxylating nicotinate-nucleotide diphosphorylase, partial [Oscillospiraceae bacterium]|nr:carboxylating nicotinate-nucleotide diphosphorylase [Oscillospiraceae bacterium]
MKMSDFRINEIIADALKEDIGHGDVTTKLTIPEDTTAKGRFIAKENGIICGLDVCERVFWLIDESTEFTARKKDGETVLAGEVFAEISGKARSLLTGERTAVNFLQRMSGIATKTAAAAAQVAGTKAKIADTRKTAPGLRILEKYAVLTGGGTNHRFNLSDGILIKDNHIAAAGGIAPALERAKKGAPHTLKIEVECENLADVSEALAAGADVIMLDNMTNENMKKAVELIGGRALVE